MSSTTDFVAELVRAANEVEKLQMIEKARLLDRAVTTIRDLRETVGIPNSDTAADRILNFQETQLLLIHGQATDAQVKMSLLEGAGMIRDLRIVLDTRMEIRINPDQRR
ncbi:hypothetical protein REJC140_03459 [Pseudorhizobium endolithicum]|uniref:Uncharacterized protein n=1 Tax=Pseudorhizobium endolithicum TaxID=1191678 RepID=A0ABM8PL21_9HYPH|nr:hypothetical protein [Pseudorhizobium endolithicum]CAD6437029.1 hypothetical protein REQ54_04183 [Rhizobium sp. Q54]CAD7035844.1 hypothetical protein REJC140_03459 [Pseudorhizobium endolithicum]